MKLVVALALCFLAAGCAKEKEEPKVSAPSSLFEAADLQAGSPFQLTAAEIANEVSYATANLAPDSDDSTSLTETENDPGESCAEKKSDALAYSADKANAVIDATIDLKDCGMLDSQAGATLTYSVAEAKLLQWFGCKNDDIEDLDGVTIAASQDKDLSFAYCKSEEDVQAMSNLIIDLQGEGKDDDGNTVSAKIKLIQAFQTIDGDPCVATYLDGNWTWSDGCLAVQRIIFNEGELFVSATYNGIVESHDPHPWFEGGFVDLKVNNWTGKVTYAGGNTAPTWEMTDGSTTKSGTVSDYALASNSLAQAVKKYGIKFK